MVAPAGRRKPAAAGAPAAAAKWSRARILWLERHVRGRGLGDVHRAALVFHHLWPAVHRWAGAIGALLLHCIAGDSIEARRSPGRRDRSRASARYRQAHADIYHALGLLLLFAVLNHLVGQSGGRDPVVYPASPGRLAVDRASAGGISFRPSIRAAPFAAFEALGPHTCADCRFDYCHALPRPFLAGGSRPPSVRFSAALDGFRGSDRHRRSVACNVPVSVEKVAAAAAA